MKKLLFTIFIILCLSVPAMANDIQWGVSIGIGDPHFYGRIDIGTGYPSPVCVYPYPMAPVYDPYYYGLAPIYLRVPPGHMHNWGMYCHHYNACQRRVYFVQDNWYHHTYAPAYHKRHGQNRPVHHYTHGQYRGDPHGRPDRHISPQPQPQPPKGYYRGSVGGYGKGQRQDKGRR